VNWNEPSGVPRMQAGSITRAFPCAGAEHPCTVPGLWLGIGSAPKGQMLETVGWVCGMPGNVQSHRLQYSTVLYKAVLLCT